MENKKVGISLIILVPFTTLAFQVLEDKIGTFELTTDYSTFPMEYQGPSEVKLPSNLPSLNSSFDLAIPLQSFGSVSVFSRSEDFPRNALGCDQPLHISMIFQASKMDFGKMIMDNFHEPSKIPVKQRYVHGGPKWPKFQPKVLRSETMRDW